MIDISAAVPKHFKANIPPTTNNIVEFGDGTEEGSLIQVSTEEGATTPYEIFVTWGTTTGSGADDAPTPAQSSGAGTAATGLPLVIGRDFPHNFRIRVGHPVKYVKVLNPHGSETVNGCAVALIAPAKRGV